MLYIHKCMQYVCAYACVYERGVFLSPFHIFFLKQGLLLNLKLTDPARLAGEEPTELWGWCMAFYAMLAIYTQVLTLAEKTLYWMGLLPRPC